MKFHAENLHHRYFIIGILEQICCFDEVFLMALTSTVQLFIERPLFIDIHVSWIMITYPISINLCKNISLECYQLSNCPSFRSSCWRCSVRKSVLRNFAKFTGKHLWQSLFFNRVAGWVDCFWSFSCLLLKIVYFISTEKWNQKGNTWWSANIYFFSQVLICLMSKEIWQIVVLSENVFKGNLMETSSFHG